MTTLQNKTALVTAASRGIGRATASALAKAGAHVLVHYGRSTQEAESLVAEIQTKGGRADAVSADLGTPDGASLLAKQVRSIVGDRLDVLVLNAGISKAARIADYTVEDFDSLFDTNVRGPFFLGKRGVFGNLTEPAITELRKLFLKRENKPEYCLEYRSSGTTSKETRTIFGLYGVTISVMVVVRSRPVDWPWPLITML